MKNELKEEKIECPLCAWEPDGQPYWMCDQCGHQWNTFQTYASCPSCGHRHRDTQCPDCSKVSPHEEWYVFLNGMLEELLEETTIAA